MKFSLKKEDSKIRPMSIGEINNRVYKTPKTIDGLLSFTLQKPYDIIHYVYHRIFIGYIILADNVMIEYEQWKNIVENSQVMFE